MRILKRGIIITLVLSLITTTASVFGNNITVYNSFDGVMRYNIIKKTELDKYKETGWTDEIPSYDSLTHTAMYSEDGRIEIFPNIMTAAQSTVGWYYTPRKLMYSADNRTHWVGMDEISAYEDVFWYTEPVALMSGNEELKYIVASDIEEYRNNGWQIVEFTDGLSVLGEEIKEYLNGKSGKYGVYIKNLKNNDTLIINDGKYMSASIIKLFVMAGVYNEIAYGGIVKNSKINGYLYNMITVSDNYSSNLLVKAIGHGNYTNGFNAENSLFKTLGLVNTSHNSLFIGYGDYVSYGKNSVSPYDCGLLLEKIYKGTLISSEYSSEMLSLLKQQTRCNKIPYPLPQDVVCANKTGETSDVQSDVGIVFSPACDYIICVITNNARNGISDIRYISDITYHYFNQN